MTRTAAREIAIQICYASQLSGTPVGEVVDSLFAPEYYATLSEENELFLGKPEEKQIAYIRELTEHVEQNMDALNGYIEKYSRGWKLGRISKVAAMILRCAMAEILYVDSVPTSVTVNEAVELAKGYEEPETVSFINGILGSFVRTEIEHEGEEEGSLNDSDET